MSAIFRKLRRYYNERFLVWLAWKLPNRLCYWAYMRVHAHATCTDYRDKHPDEVTWSQAAVSWERRKLGERSDYPKGAKPWK